MQPRTGRSELNEILFGDCRFLLADLDFNAVKHRTCCADDADQSSGLRALGNLHKKKLVTSTKAVPLTTRNAAYRDCATFYSWTLEQFLALSGREICGMIMWRLKLYGVSLCHLTDSFRNDISTTPRTETLQSLRAASPKWPSVLRLDKSANLRTTNASSGLDASLIDYCTCM